MAQKGLKEYSNKIKIFSYKLKNAVKNRLVIQFKIKLWLQKILCEHKHFFKRKIYYLTMRIPSSEKNQ